jgi:hypothetical protein
MSILVFSHTHALSFDADGWPASWAVKYGKARTTSVLGSVIPVQRMAFTDNTMPVIKEQLRSGRQHCLSSLLLLSTLYLSLGNFCFFILLSLEMTFVTPEELAALENLRVLFVRPSLYLLPLKRVFSSRSR